MNHDLNIGVIFQAVDARGQPFEYSTWTSSLLSDFLNMTIEQQEGYLNTLYLAARADIRKDPTVENYGDYYFQAKYSDEADTSITAKYGVTDKLPELEVFLE